ncbi:MAG: hypothetical protein KDH20_22845 [Rhodocyclaceae bacterium]|nr:hypothetical protein [Rhodocyclaceae bacterium]
MQKGLSTLLAALVTACASPVEVPPGDLRVIVRFGSSTDPADPALLARMSQAVGSPVQLSSQISDRESAYWIRCTVSDPYCDDRMLRLFHAGDIIGIDPDRFRYPTEPTR